MLKKHEQLKKRAQRALEAHSDSVVNAKSTIKKGYYKRFKRTALYNLPHLTEAIVKQTVTQMEADGYSFERVGVKTYSLTVEDIREIYRWRDVQTLREKHPNATTILIGNLKGGVSKTVTTVNVAHCLRTLPSLLHLDIRVLVIDLDTQASGSLFLDHTSSIKRNDFTAAQAMLTDLTREELLNEYVIPSSIDGVDLIPASIDDAFIASEWEKLCKEHQPGKNLNDILKENIINKLSGDYDFIFIDSGPHLDYFLKNSLSAADILFTPVPPATVDFSSTMKYLTRLPSMLSEIAESGSNIGDLPHVGFMTKMQKGKADHATAHNLTKGVFGGDMLDVTIPKLDGFERTGETFDTVISADPKLYGGGADALNNAKSSIEEFTRAMYERIEFIRLESEL